MEELKPLKRKYMSYSSRHLRRIIKKKTTEELMRLEGSSKSSEPSSDLNISINAEPSDIDATNSIDESSPNVFHSDSSESADECNVVNDETSVIYYDESEFHVINDDLEKDNLQFPFESFEDSKANYCLKDDLRAWSLECDIEQTALSKLLKILDKYVLEDLPKDARTLLRTKRIVETSILPPGKYYHFGFEKAIKDIITDRERNNLKSEEVDLLINVDGLPLTKSSKNCFWPILCSDTLLKQVYLVGMYYGSGKPDEANVFLEQFASEAKYLLSSSYNFNSEMFDVKITRLVCDAPAKSFILKIKGHGGYSSCTKCNIEGSYIKGRVCFAGDVADLRSDEDFIRQTDEDYHMGTSVLTKIPNFGLVTNVALDYMHIVCLGVVRKLLNLWVSSAPKSSTRLGVSQISEISVKMLALRDTVPSDFARKPRSLYEMNCWKATEFRSFLLYLGPVVLGGVLKTDFYLNFLSLHIAIIILSCPELVTEYVDYAEELLKHFVQSFSILYGKENVSHNVHSLLHLAADVRKFGALDSFSAFRFENFMQQIKKQIRKSEKPLEQVVKRYSEKKEFCQSSFQSRISESFSNQHSDGPSLTSNKDAQYKIYRYKNFLFNCTDEGNNCALLKDQTFVSIKNFILDSHKNEYMIIGNKLKTVSDLYTSPGDSSLCGIYVAKQSDNFRSWPVSDIRKKVWKMPFKQNLFALFPILHF